MSDCLFCNISRGNIPADVVYQDDNLVAFRDINPQAPTHILVIPRKHIASLNELQPDDSLLLGQMVLAARQLATSEGLANDGYRTVFNCNSAGGQMVYHIHLHLLGGRQMTWPPG